MVKGKDDFVIVFGMEIIFFGVFCMNILMVVDFFVYGEDLFLVGIIQGLFFVLRVYDGEVFMGQDGRVVYVDVVLVWFVVVEFL